MHEGDDEQTTPDESTTVAADDVAAEAPAAEEITVLAAEEPTDDDTVAEEMTAETSASPAEDATAGEVAATADASSAIAASGEDEIEPLADDAPAETDERLMAILESVLFACGEPITLARLSEVVAGPSKRELRAALTALADRTERERRGLRLIEVAGGYQFRTAPEHAEWVRRLFQQRPWRLTRATLETLAIVAYKQPITRAEIESIRGVDVDSVVAALLSRKLVRIVGRKEVIGRPLLYGTTRQFLEVFSLRDLAALPGLAEVASAMPETVEAGAASSGEETWSSDERADDEGHSATEAAGGLGDLLAPSGGDDDRERPGNGERHDGQDPGDTGASD